MSSRRTLSGHMGRGLAALIPTEVQRVAADSDTGLFAQLDPAAPLPVAGLRLIDVDPALVLPNPRQPRQEFDPDALAELARSLVEVGMLQPIVVRANGAGSEMQRDGSGHVGYELVAGERRLRAARMAGLSQVPAIVRSTGDDDMLREALLENLQRVQLNPIEEAASYEQLLADFGGTHEELAGKLGRSRPQISNTLRLLRLPPAVQRRVAAGVLSAGHARALLGLDDATHMDSLAKRIVAEGLSVRAVEEIVSVGSKPKRPRTQKKRETQQPELDQLAIRLSDKLDTRVKVSAVGRRGKIVIDFADIEDLHRIATLLGDSAGS